MKKTWKGTLKATSTTAGGYRRIVRLDPKGTTNEDNYLQFIDLIDQIFGDELCHNKKAIVTIEIPESTKEVHGRINWEPDNPLFESLCNQCIYNNVSCKFNEDPKNNKPCKTYVTIEKRLKKKRGY